MSKPIKIPLTNVINFISEKIDISPTDKTGEFDVFYKIGIKEFLDFVEKQINENPNGFVEIDGEIFEGKEELKPWQKEALSEAQKKAIKDAKEINNG